MNSNIVAGVSAEVEIYAPKKPTQRRLAGSNKLMADRTSNATAVTNSRYTASIYPANSGELPSGFAEAVMTLESRFDMPIWLLCHKYRVSNESEHLTSLTDQQYLDYIQQRPLIEPHKQIALLIDSPGGSISTAYRIAKFLQDHCGGYIAIIPRYAKSAATLLALGADAIIMGQQAELGPMDIQVQQDDSVHDLSVLNETQAVQKIRALTLEGVDDMLSQLPARTGIGVPKLLPMVMNCMVEFHRPLIEQINPVRFSRMSRILQISKDYAQLLMRKNYPMDSMNSLSSSVERIIEFMVETYACHEFVVDHHQAKALGLRVYSVEPQTQAIFDSMMTMLGNFAALGVLQKREE